MSWQLLPAELHLAVVHLLPHSAVRALAATSAAARALCLPAIFADVALPSAASLLAFTRHVPPEYGQYVRSLAVCTKHPTGAHPSTDALLDLLRTCPRLGSLSLSLASPIDAEKAIPVFARLSHVHSFHIGCWGREEVAPVSERLVVALAASLPSLAHLSLSRITRSAIHVDPCDVPYDVPLVTNDVDVPPHPLFGSDLALPTLLRIPSLRTLDIRDTWLGCDAKIEPATPLLEKLVLTGSMYATDTRCESQACTAWLHACPALRSLELGIALAPLPEHATPCPPRLSRVHINASRVLADDLASTLDTLKPCSVECISIAYEQERHTGFQDLAPKAPCENDFARECALDDLSDWRTSIDAFLLARSKEAWSALSRVDVSLAQDVRASWSL